MKKINTFTSFQKFNCSLPKSPKYMLFLRERVPVVTNDTNLDGGRRSERSIKSEGVVDSSAT